MMTPRVAAIHDMSGFGRCSLTVAIPILSAMGVQCCPLPTAFLSTHTGGFEGFTFLDMTDEMSKVADHWASLGLTFQAVYSGFLGSERQIGVVEDTAAQQKYGVVQTVYKQEDGKDAQTEAKALLQTLEQTGSVTGCPGDSWAVSGYALIVQETTTGLFGKFYIESDTHTFTDGKHEMALTLAFSNMMDEMEIENQSQG